MSRTMNPARGRQEAVLPTNKTKSPAMSGEGSRCRERLTCKQNVCPREAAAGAVSGRLCRGHRGAGKG